MLEHKGPQVAELFFYPIKSFRGLRTSELRLTPLGPQWDRQWMIVDGEGKFLTQRQIPRLATLGVAMDEASIELSRRDIGSIDFGLEEREGDEFKTIVWKAEMPAFEVSREVSEWISEAIGQKVRLVRMSETAKREVPELPERGMRFVDSRPLLVIGRDSLDQLEKAAGITISMSRFRPNVVLSHTPAHAEDQWAGFKIGAIDFQALEPCTRCKITTVHPLTGVVGEEPLKTLATYRRQEKGICFGYYYAHLRDGLIKIGAPVFPH